MAFKHTFLTLLLLIPLTISAQKTGTPKTNPDAKMTVEIWSDMVCPFCYIGKRKFEAALAQFPQKDKINVVWKSFQLSPDMKSNPSKNAIESLAEEKGISLEKATAMTTNVTQWAKEVGLVYNFDKSIAANTFNAHRFMQFAKQYGKQNEAEEIVFRSFFTDGKNIDDYPTLIKLGLEIGLDSTALSSALKNGLYADAVKADMAEARTKGIHGVPHFLFNGKQVASGAQEPKVFLKALENSFNEWQKK